MSELSIKHYVYSHAMKRRIPVSGTFELTPRCNLSCRMCYIRMSGAETSARGRELTTEQWLTIGRQAVRAGMIYLLITGGEPMLRSDFTTIYTEMIKQGVVISVNTNGTLITPAIVECFKQHPPECVNVSLYGVSSETYASLCGVAEGYERALKGIKALKEAGVRVVINTTFTTCNQGDMEALVALAQELQIPIRTAAYTFPPVRNHHSNAALCLSPQEQGRLNARFDFLASSQNGRLRKADYLRKCLEKEAASSPTGGAGKPSDCLAGRGLFWIAWNGEMYPCGMLSDHGVVTREDFRDLETMWGELVDKMNAIYLPAACADCALKRACPSCAAVTYTRSRDASVLVQDMCLYTKTYIQSYLEMVDGMERGDVAPPTQNESLGVDPFMCL